MKEEKMDILLAVSTAFIIFVLGIKVGIWLCKDDDPRAQRKGSPR